MAAPPNPTSDCPTDEVLLAYLGERLPEREAEQLEAHYLACDRCWQEVRRGLEIRAGFAEETGVATEPSPREAPRAGSRRPLRWAVAAAVTALAVAGLWQLRRPGDRIVRGGAEAIELVAEARDGAISVRWSAIPTADVYRVQFFSRDGRLLHQEETAAIQIESETGEPRSSPTADFVRVEALDTLRRVIASSDLAQVAEGGESVQPP